MCPRYEGKPKDHLGVAWWVGFAGCATKLLVGLWSAKISRPCRGASLRAYGASFGEGDATFPLALIEEAVGAAGVREQRRRLLPAVAVVVFVLGLCLFSGEGYREVACKLTGWLAPLAGRAGWHLPGT